MRRFTKAALLFAGAVVLVSACDRAFEPNVPEATPAAQRAALIDDGAHGGNPDFFFLPPIARRTRAADPFDASQKPVVEICLWQSNACKKLVSRLTDVKVRGSSDEDDIEADDDDEETTERERRGFYSVRWRTRGLNLDAAKTYRIRVLVGGTELGTADVDVVRHAREKKQVDRARFVPLVAGKNLKIRFRIEKGAVTVRGAAGGQIVAQGGRVQLDIPAGALSRDVGFTIVSSSAPEQPNGFVAAAYDFGPDGLRFNQPVQLTLRYDDAALPPNVEPTLRLQKLVGMEWVVVPQSSIDVEANTVTGLIDGFSTYGIVTWNGSVFTFQGSGTAVVDGALRPGEWDNAAGIDVTFGLPGGGTVQGRFRVMNDGTNLYLAIEFPHSANGFIYRAGFVFDNDNDGGGFETGDDELLYGNTTLAGLGDAFLQVPGSCGLPACAQFDALAGGTIDGSAAYRGGAGSVFEFAHPLASLDPTHDFSLIPGQTVGFLLLVEIENTATHTFQGTAWPPSGVATSFAAPPAWAQIFIAPVPPVVVPPDTGTVTAGMNHTCAIEQLSGLAYCWGLNTYGALGNRSRTVSNVPVQVVATPAFASVSAGSADPLFLGAHTCAIKTDGSAHCWGLNNYGQLGTGGATAPIDTAHPVNTSLRFRSISAGQDYTCAVTVTFEGYCWGANVYGALGNGTQGVSHALTLVSGGHRWSMISAGDLHTCGVTVAHEMYCWGANNFGQLGVGVQGPPRLTPQLVATGFHAVSAGADHSCGIDLTSQLHCWGLNLEGQLGDGTLTMRPAPVLVGSNFNHVDVGGGASLPGPTSEGGFTCGVKFTGAAFCWGRNTSGQLGDGLSPPAFPNWLPVAVTGGHWFWKVSAGTRHACGVTLFGETYCWGSNVYGELGRPGIVLPPATPSLVSGGRLWY